MASINMSSREKHRMDPRTILWRRIDIPGHESARLSFREQRWRLEGRAVFAAAEGPAALGYEVVCDEGWQTLSGTVDGWVGSEAVAARVEVADGKRWILNGVEVPAVSGALDVDLNFSPSTNLLPIRRLELAVGEEATVKAAWLRFPSFTLEPLEQTYRRTGNSSWRYESAGGKFVRDLEVDESGLVTRYPGIWVAE
jgi:uncharacterized protein